MNKFFSGHKKLNKTRKNIKKRSKTLNKKRRTLKKLDKKIINTHKMSNMSMTSDLSSEEEEEEEEEEGEEEEEEEDVKDVSNGKEMDLKKMAFLMNVIKSETKQELYHEYHIKRRKPINPDGNCQYRARADQIYGSQKYYDIVKERILESISGSSEFYISTFDNNIGKFNKWFFNMQNPYKSEWGTIETLRAACIYYNRPIVVYDETTELVHLYDPKLLRLSSEKTDEEYNSDELVLIFNGSDHYDSVVYKKIEN